MELEDLERFADDLRERADLRVELFPDANPSGLHVLRINHVDFFFYADGSGYDGWGMQTTPDATV